MLLYISQALATETGTVNTEVVFDPILASISTEAKNVVAKTFLFSNNTHFESLPFFDLRNCVSHETMKIRALFFVSSGRCLQFLLEQFIVLEKFPECVGTTENYLFLVGRFKIRR